MLTRIVETTTSNAGGYIVAIRGVHELDEIEANDTMKIVWSEAGAPPPQVHMPPAMNNTVVQASQMFRELAHGATGVNEMSAQGRKEPGVESGIAIRTVSDLQDQRFLPKSRAYEALITSIGRHIIWSTKELEESGVKPSVFLPGSHHLEEIDWEGFDLEENMYEVRIDPMSSGADTLAGRMSTLQDLAANGMIKPETLRRAAISLNPDLEAATARESASERYFDGLIARFEAADEKDSDVYEAPDPITDLGLGLVMMSEAYAEMKASFDTPEHNLGLVREWIKQADELLSGGPGADAPPPGAGVEGLPPNDPAMAPPMDPAAMPPEGIPPEMAMPPGPPMA